jgi:hypothetical protein
MNDSWFSTKCHDITSFTNNLNKVSLALDTGREKPAEKIRGIEEILAAEKSEHLNAG